MKVITVHYLCGCDVIRFVREGATAEDEYFTNHPCVNHLPRARPSFQEELRPKRRRPKKGEERASNDFDIEEISGDTDNL